MSCECGCNNCNTGLAGLLGATLPAYSSIRVGFHLGPIVDLFSWSGTDAINKAKQQIEDCLWGSNSFYDLVVTLQDTPTENYLLIQAKTVFDFGDKEDVGGYIWQQLDSCGFGSLIKSRDAVAVDAIPAEFANNPNIQQPVTYYQGNPNAKGKCDWNALSFSDYLACELGITTSQAVAVGVVGALAGVILISKLVK